MKFKILLKILIFYQGDSGGGLYYYNGSHKRYIVSGITSYGEGCARDGKPGYSIIKH